MAEPIATDIQQQFRTLDPTTRELFFGSGVPGTSSYSPGFMQQAFRASERTFYDEQGNPVVVPQKIAGLSPEQLAAIGLSREKIGVQDPYMQKAEQAFGTGIESLFGGTESAKRYGEKAIDVLGAGLGEERQLRERALESLFGGTESAKRYGEKAIDVLGTGLGEERQLRERGLESLFGGIEEARGLARGAEEQYGRGLAEAGDYLRQAGTSQYDPSSYQQFMDPYQEEVIDQVRKDILERGAMADISARASDIARGGESAFGSRARLGAEERTEALGRGLGEALGGLRSQGFQQAQQTAMGEFGRQQQALQQLGGGIANISGQRASGQRGLGQTLAGYGQLGQQALTGAGQQALLGQQALASQLGASGNLEQQIAQQRQQAQFGAGQQALLGQQAMAGQLGMSGGLEQQIAQQRQQAQFGAGQAYSGLGGQAQQSAQADIQRQLGLGQMTQGLQQAQLDAARQNALMQQQAPMQQMQSLLPFVQSVPAGFSQVGTTYGVQPSALQTGLGVGLSALGGLGSFFNPPQYRTFA
jgi:hypothetical protein